MAAFEGLFPDDHDARVQNLIYSAAHHHALVKLRVHTPLTLDALDSWTAILGSDARAFLDLTCEHFVTLELKREYEARKRREARKESRKKKTSVTSGVSSAPVTGEWWS